MSTSLLALCCQSGPDATWETPISAWSRFEWLQISTNVAALDCALHQPIDRSLVLTQVRRGSSLSSAGADFNRVGLHYIDFSEPTVAKTRIAELSTPKMAELSGGMTKFG